MGLKETQDKIVANMKNWQKIENASVASVSDVIEKTDNQVIKIVMEIIKRDSEMHHRIQQMIVDCLESSTVEVSSEDLVKVWDLIEKHIAIEERAADLASQSLEATKDSKGMLVPRYLLTYLMTDEAKHDKLLADLELFKKGMYS
jgi:exoribonuclease R